MLPELFSKAKINELKLLLNAISLILLPTLIFSIVKILEKLSSNFTLYNDKFLVKIQNNYYAIALKNY